MVSEMATIDWEALEEAFPRTSRGALRGAIQVNGIRSKRRWTWEEGELIKEKREAGWTIDQILELLPHRTKQGILKYISTTMRETGQKRATWSQQDELYLEQMHDKLTIRELAARFNGKTYNAVYQKLKRMGLNNSPKGWNNARQDLTEEEKEMIKGELAKGKTVGVIAKQFGITPPSVTKLKK